MKKLLGKYFTTKNNKINISENEAGADNNAPALNTVEEIELIDIEQIEQIELIELIEIEQNPPRNKYLRYVPAVSVIMTIAACAAFLIMVNGMAKKHNSSGDIEVAAMEEVTAVSDEDVTDNTNREENEYQPDEYEISTGTLTEGAKDKDYTVNNDVMKNIISDNKTASEDVKNKNQSQAATQKRPAETEKETETQRQTTTEVSVFAMKNDRNIYTIKESVEMAFTDEEYSRFKTDTIYVNMSGEIKEYIGAVYSTGNASDVCETITVITGFLVEKEDTPAASVNETVADDVEEETGKDQQDATETLQEKATKEEESSIAEEESIPSSDKKNYTLMTLEAEKESRIIASTGWQTINNNKYYFKSGTPVTGWNNIDGRQYYFNGQGILSSTLVIDVSKYNGDIDWKAVKDSGIEYAIIRAAYRGYSTGRLSRDSYFEQNINNATAAGLKVGVYIYSSAINTAEAVDEASLLVNLCKPYNVTLPLIIDVEDSESGAGRADKLSMSERTSIINAFCSTVKSAGYSAMVYANKDWLTNCINVSDINTGCWIWMAQYSSKFTYSGSFDMWQFTSSGTVPGITGPVDISAWLH
ncbi:MAG: GH25 family lysozyme [Lachnospira sp.]